MDKMTMICQQNKAASSSPPVLAPGFRLLGTRALLLDKESAISEGDIYKKEPWELPGLSKMRSRDLEWYFYSALDKKYGNGARMNRATGNDRSIKHKSRTVGMKKTLVFHKGRAPGGKCTNWGLVDEELERLGSVKDGYVLCRVFQKSGLGPPNGDQYAPFDDLVPKLEAVDEGVVSDEAEPRDGSSLEGNGQDEKTT